MKTFYSIRTVKAENLDEAMHKICDEDFDEENNLCDKICEKDELIALLNSEE
jgi:hypothetical protein